MKHLFWMAPAAVMVASAPVFSVQYLSVEQAQSLCFPKATKFVSKPIMLTDQQISDIQSRSGVSVRNKKQMMWQAYNGTDFLGWLISDSVIGKHDWIDWVLALNPDGSVRQIEILEYRENYGSEIRKSEWRAQFVGKKTGDSLKLNQDIRNITGSTLSSRHVTEGVKRLLALYDIVLQSH